MLPPWPSTPASPLFFACGGSGAQQGATDATAGSTGSTTADPTTAPSTATTGDTPTTAEPDPCAASPQALADCVEQAAYTDDLKFIANIRTPGSTHWQAVQDLCADRLTELGYQVQGCKSTAAASTCSACAPGP